MVEFLLLISVKDKGYSLKDKYAHEQQKMLLRLLVITHRERRGCLSKPPFQIQCEIFFIKQNLNTSCLLPMYM